MANRIEVPTGGYSFAQAPDRLVTIGVGSCLAICLYSPERKVGALIHSMLPRAGQHVTNPSLYVDTALNVVLEKFAHAGIDHRHLFAKLVGGAEMFPGIQQIDNAGGIGQRNVEEASRLLKILGIPVASTSLGGNRGRSLSFDMENGVVSIAAVSATDILKI